MKIVTMYYASSVKAEETETGIPLSIDMENHLYDYEDVLHRKEESAIADAKRETKYFNKKFGTEFKWEELFSIEKDSFYWDGDMHCWCRW